LDQRFLKDNRILKRVDFLQFKISDGLKWSNKFLLVILMKNNDCNSRIGISISKKCGNACKRNLVKRLIRENFRVSSIKNLGLDLHFIVKRHIKINDISREEFKKHINQCFLDINNKFGAMI